MNITRFTFWIPLASFALVAGCATPKPNSEQLDQLTRRTSILEQKVHDLEVTNAELQMQVRMLQQQPSLQSSDMAHCILWHSCGGWRRGGWIL